MKLGVSFGPFKWSERSASSRKKPLRDRGDSLYRSTSGTLSWLYGCLPLSFFFSCDYWHVLAYLTCLSCLPS